MEWLYCVPRARSASEIHIAATTSVFWYWYSTTLETCTGFYMHETSPNVNSVPRDTWHRGRGFESRTIYQKLTCLLSGPNSPTGFPYTSDGPTKSFTLITPKMAKCHPNNPAEEKLSVIIWIHIWIVLRGKVNVIERKKEKKKKVHCFNWIRTLTSFGKVPALFKSDITSQSF